jgi:LysM repeat protein
MEKRARPESLRGLGCRDGSACAFSAFGLRDGRAPRLRRAARSRPASHLFHRRRAPGDTLGSIGARYDVSTSTIAHMNDLGRQDELRVGELLRVPAASRRTREAVFHDATTGPFRATHATVTTRPLPPVPPPPVTVARNDAVPRTAARSNIARHAFQSACVRRRSSRRRRAGDARISHSRCRRHMATDISSGLSTVP